MTWQTRSTNSAETEKLAANIGSALKGGEVIELVSDLGGGKTTFVRGLARGIGSRDHVASPTFTIRREYHASKLTLYHYDFYRLQQSGNIAQELIELLNDPGSVVVIEWPKIVQHVLPVDRLSIILKQIDSTTRQIDFQCPRSFHYLIDVLR